MSVIPDTFRTGLYTVDLCYFKAPLQPEESISKCLSFVNRATIADSGRFFSLDGNPEAISGE